MFSYKPLFKLLIEHNMNKTQFQEAIKISSATVAKLAKNEYESCHVN